MASHRQGRRHGRRRRAGWLAGAMLVTGAAVLVLAVVRAAPSPARLTAGPAPAPAASTAQAASRFEGTWAGPLQDPDTATVDVRLTVGGPARGIVLKVPSLRCTYRGPDPAPGGGSVALADVHRDGTDGADGADCADTARIRLAAAGAEGPATDRVRYELLGSCDGSVCATRRASGLLAAWRPGP